MRNLRESIKSARESRSKACSCRLNHKIWNARVDVAYPYEKIAMDICCWTRLVYLESSLVLIKRGVSSSNPARCQASKYR